MTDTAETEFTATEFTATEFTATEAQIRAFGERYQYDADYIVALLNASPAAYRSFAAAQGMSVQRQALPLAAHFVARVVTMQVADCGPCAQLNLRMAVEAGVDRKLLATLIEQPDLLPRPLLDVATHVRAAVSGAPSENGVVDRIRQAYGEAGLAELAVCVAGSLIYPMTKRVLQMAGTCERLSVDF